MIKRIINLLCLVLTFLIVFSITVSADVYSNDDTMPYNSYTYWENYSGSGKTAVYNKPIYKIAVNLSYSDMGISSQFKKLTDVCTDSNGRVFLLDGGASSVAVLDQEYQLIASFDSINKSGEKIEFAGASGIFVDNDIIYIADTENARVITADINGTYKGEYLLPKSRLIPSNFKYRPIKIVRDSRGYMYVLSDGSYYGAILYSPDNEFLGFYGADNVKNTVTQVISNLINRLVMNNDKRAASESVLPYQFTDLCVDKKDFIFTVTGYTTNLQKGQIRKLSPGGKNVLNSDSINFADNYTTQYKQDLHSIAVDDSGYVYALDSAYGHIFVYDQNSNLLGVFGSGTRSGVQDGTFTFPAAIALKNDDVIVIDSSLNTVTVFTITEYGTLFKEAQTLTNDGKYIQAKKLWEEINLQDKHNQLAYIGIAKACYDEGDYKNALKYSKIGCDRATYALAFKEIRNSFLINNFTLLIVLAVVFIIFIIFLLKLKKKKGIVVFSSNVRLMFSVLKSPSASFDEIKQKNKGSVLAAIVVLLLFYVTTVMKTIYGGFCFTEFSKESFNSLFVFVQTAGCAALFTVCFWGVSTLMSGQGKIKEIFLAVCYSLQPMIIANIFYIVMTNFMLPSELGFLNLFMTIMTGYTAFILFLSLMRICDYEFLKLIGVLIVTVAGMVIVIFVGLVIILLLQLLFGFVRTILNEIVKMITVGG